MRTVDGLHHVTAIAGDAQANLDFYRDALGLRFVKKTVNFDDPGTYHLYYGNERGDDGSVMTFFPWSGIRRGKIGAGQVSLTQFAVPRGALPFWEERLADRKVSSDTVFGEARAVFEDPDGLRFAIVEVDGDTREPWVTDDISTDTAIRGFRGVTLTLTEGETTGALLTGALGYTRGATEGTVTRFRAASGPADIVDLDVDVAHVRGQEGAGVVHHVAFSVPDRAAQIEVRAQLEAAGQQVTQQIDRDYFWAIYTRTPGGVLFEVATEEPGFTRDETLEALGTALKLPTQHEPLRARIEEVLPPLHA